MATRRVIDENGDEHVRASETTVVETGRGGGGAGWLVALAAIAFLAIAAFFLMNATRNDAIETAAVSDAASSVAGSVDNAADSVAGAAGSVTVPAEGVELPTTAPAPAD